jgi:hypothetical protein
MTPIPNRHLLVRLRLEECESRVAPAAHGLFLLAPDIIGGQPHGSDVAEMHRAGDGLPAAAARVWRDIGETATIAFNGITEGAVLIQIFAEPVTVYVSLTPPGHGRDVDPSAVTLDTPSADNTVPAAVISSTSGAAQVATTPVTPAPTDTPLALQSASAGKSSTAVGSGFHGVEVGAGISAGGASAALNSGAHLPSPGLPSVGWLAAGAASGWLAAYDSVIPAPTSGQGSASNQPRTEAPAAGLVSSTSGAGIDTSDASVSPAQNGMTDEPQESTPPAGAAPAGDPGKAEEAPAGPATPGAPDATGPSGGIRADGGELQTIAAPAESVGDVSGLEGSVGQLFGWVTDLSSLSAGNELGLYLALVALGASAAAAEVRRRKHRAESKNYTEATQQPRMAVLNVPA